MSIMKRILILFCSIILVASDMVVSGQTRTLPVLTEKGIGSITIGMRKSKVPAAIPGLYDKIEYEAASPDDMDFGGAGWFTCTLRGKETMAIFIGAERDVCGISVFTPKVKSADGVYVSMPVSRLKQLKGIEYETECMGDPYYYSTHNGAEIQYYTNFTKPETVRIMAVGMTY